MRINNKHHHTIWIEPNNTQLIHVFDQRYFPHKTSTFSITSSDEAAFAIKEMVVRGAPLIGVTAAYGMYLGCLEAMKTSNFKEEILKVEKKLNATRPTAVNLIWATKRMRETILSPENTNKTQTALDEAHKIKEEDIAICHNIGLHGVALIEEISKRKNGKPVNILTHCNAGWLATTDWGTATSPIYQAHKNNIPIHVWVDETRPRNQGSNLTAFELDQEGVAHTLITDNTGGHLMQHGMVDIAIVGTDRTTRCGDVANKIGTYLKALAAKDNNIPFYVALPSSTIDWEIKDGIKEIPIETRSEDEVKYIQGKTQNGIEKVLICPENTPAINYGFDVTPARLVTGLITERGICEASEEGITQLFNK